MDSFDMAITVPVTFPFVRLVSIPCDSNGNSVLEPITVQCLGTRCDTELSCRIECACSYRDMEIFGVNTIYLCLGTRHGTMAW
jgi:hypothetical protein